MEWAETLTAISTALIAVVLAGGAVVTVTLLRELRQLMADLSKLTRTIDSDGKPAIQSLRSMIDDASAVVTTVKTEVDGLASTSKLIRKRAERTAASIEDRLRDAEALVDVLQEEVEETALDVAAAIRTSRRGGKLFKRMKRALLKRGRRQ